MKKPLLLFVFLVNSIILNAQLNMSLKMRFNDSISVEKYKPEETDFKYKSIPIEPGDYRIINNTVPRILY